MQSFHKKSGAWFYPSPAVKTDSRLIAFATTSTATAAAAVFTTTATAATAGRAFFTRLGNVDRQSAAIQLRAVQGGNGFLRFFRRAHGDETETARTAAHAVHHQVGF